MEQHKLEVWVVFKHTAAFTGEVIDNVFTNAEDALKNTHPSLISNYDETNLTENPGAKENIFKMGTKYPETVINSTKTAINLIYAGTAAGELVPVLYYIKQTTSRTLRPREDLKIQDATDLEADCLILSVSKIDLTA